MDLNSNPRSNSGLARQSNMAVPMVMPDMSAGPSGGRRGRRASLVGAMGGVVGGAVGGVVGGTLGAVTGSGSGASKLKDADGKKGKGFFKDRSTDKASSTSRSVKTEGVVASYTNNERDRRRMGSLNVEGDRRTPSKSGPSYSDRILQGR